MAEDESKEVAPVLQSEPESPVSATSDTDIPPVLAREPQSKPASPTESAAAEPAPARSGGFGRFVGLTFGGIIAAGLGFGLATYGVQQRWPLLTTQDTGQDTGDQAALDALHGQITTLTTRLAEVEARPTPPDSATPDLTPLENRLATLEARPETSPAADLGPLQQRITALEAEIAALKPADSAAIAAEIEAQVATRMDAVKAEAEALTAGAERQAALIGLQAALRSGQGLPEAEAAIKASGVTLPDPVTAYLANPVALQTLQASFPEAARAALAAARTAARADGSVTDRMAVFLLNQTGARAATPREGDDPDAVLSRAEAALAAGDLASVMPLLAALPEAAQPALADWKAQAERLLAAQTALAQSE